MALSDGLLPGLSIHHSVNIGGALASFAPYALVSDAGVAVISLTEGQRAPSWQVTGAILTEMLRGKTWACQRNSVSSQRSLLPEESCLEGRVELLA